MVSMSEKLSYCAELVKEQDLDRFLLTMLMPAAVRGSLLALFAFNHEIAKTREVVTETQLGLIRLQWWRDALAGIYDEGKVLEHEVLSALAGVIEAHDLERKYFEELIYAREFDLEDVLPAHMDGFLSYCDFTNTPLMKLVMQVMGDAPDGEPVQPIAINYALVGLMRAVPFHAHQRRCYLPQDIMQRHGQSINRLYELKPDESLPEIVELCMDHFRDDLKPQSKFLKASHVLAQIYARQLKSTGYDTFSQKMTLEPPLKAFRLFAGMFM